MQSWRQTETTAAEVWRTTVPKQNKTFPENDTMCNSITYYKKQCSEFCWWCRRSKHIELGRQITNNPKPLQNMIQINSKCGHYTKHSKQKLNYLDKSGPDQEVTFKSCWYWRPQRVCGTEHITRDCCHILITGHHHWEPLKSETIVLAHITAESLNSITWNDNQINLASFLPTCSIFPDTLLSAIISVYF